MWDVPPPPPSSSPLSLSHSFLFVPFLIFSRVRFGCFKLFCFPGRSVPRLSPDQSPSIFHICSARVFWVLHFESHPRHAAAPRSTVIAVGLCPELSIRSPPCCQIPLFYSPVPSFTFYLMRGLITWAHSSFLSTHGTCSWNRRIPSITHTHAHTAQHPCTHLNPVLFCRSVQRRGFYCNEPHFLIMFFYIHPSTSGTDELDKPYL